MEERELIKRIKKSFQAKKSRAEILSKFQKRGYKLAYGEELIKKAIRPKKLIIIAAISIFILGILSFSIFSLTSENKQNLEKSEDESSVSMQANSRQPRSVGGGGSQSQSGTQQASQAVPSINYDEIEVTSEFILFLLNEIGANSLHKSVLGREPAIMNFYIEEKSFYSEIDKEIEVFQGTSPYADVEFFIDKSDLIDSVYSPYPLAVFKVSLETKDSWMELRASEPELLGKGYLGLYNSLK